MNISVELQPCLRKKSGIGVYAYEIISELCKLEEVQLKGDMFNFCNRQDVDQYVRDLNLKKDVCKKISYGIYRRMWNCMPIKYNSLFEQNAEIYHFFDYIVPPNITGKVVTTIHDLTYIIYPETMQKKTLNRIKNDIEYSVKRADRIVTISESTKRDIIKLLDVDEEKIDIIPPGVDCDLFAKKIETTEIMEIKKKYNLPPKYILYMGTLEPRKNIESIVKAFYKFKSEEHIIKSNMKLAIAGKKGWMYETIFKIVKELNIENDVVFTDYVDEEDKPVIYQNAEMFIFPSIYEGFGIPILEAMAASIPVITSNASSMPEVAGNAAILVEPKDSDEICESIKQILEDKDLKEKLILRGRKQCEKFSWKKSVEKLMEVYKNVIFDETGD